MTFSAIFRVSHVFQLAILVFIMNKISTDTPSCNRNIFYGTGAKSSYQNDLQNAVGRQNSHLRTATRVKRLQINCAPSASIAAYI